ncbi:hypothetical protein L2E82_15047 [Cichorium intybus]|uniref:Uncharacterized protein n=1 Tax=Cichorium intybus TaxID=13427 RepID=A0ACB9F2W1_CICIN|nr:hypothetical protein L2E82_15047 [Cichorium intybus]
MAMNMAEQSNTSQGMTSTQAKNVPNNIPAIIDLYRKEVSPFIAGLFSYTLLFGFCKLQDPKVTWIDYPLYHNNLCTSLKGSFTTENNRGAEKCSAHLVHHFLKTRLLPPFPSNQQQKPQFQFSIDKDITGILVGFSHRV